MLPVNNIYYLLIKLAFSLAMLKEVLPASAGGVLGCM